MDNNDKILFLCFHGAGSLDTVRFQIGERIKEGGAGSGTETGTGNGNGKSCKNKGGKGNRGIQESCSRKTG